MKKKYALDLRLISLLLCAVLVLGLIPPMRSQAASASKIYTTAELANGGVNIVPNDLTSNSAFMNRYVYNSNTLNLNGSFKLASSQNADGASSDRLPQGTIDGNKSKKWYASYKWEPTQAERDVMARSDVAIVFKANMIPNYHKHWYIFWTEEHWSVSGIRLTRSDGNGNNTWTYGQNDYGYRPNGDTIASFVADKKNSGSPQAISTQYWDDFPAGKAMYYNAYYVWENDCGNPKTSGAVCYLFSGGNPYIKDVSFSGEKHQRIPDGGTTSTVTIHFSEQVRFADNAAHDGIKLYLDAEYLDQTSKTGGFQITANFVEMGTDYMTFRFDVKEAYEHFRITGLSANQPDLMKQTDLKVYDGNGRDIGANNLSASSVLTDMVGNSFTYRGYDFSDRYFDGVYPKLTKVDISGKDVSAQSTQPPTNWNANSGNNRFVYAGVNDKLTFKAYFSENIDVEDMRSVQAVLSIRDGNGNPVKLALQYVSDNFLAFKELTVTADMKAAGQRIYIDHFENLTVTDYAGNPCTTRLTSGIMMPAQDIALDVDKPLVNSSVPDGNKLSEDPLIYRPYAESSGAEYFSFPVTFRDMDNNGADHSGVAGMDISFSLNMPSGNKYAYRWAMDTRQTVSNNTQWKNGTTGSANVFEDLADGTQYWVHIALDPNVDYDYTTAEGAMDANGVYFIGRLDFSSVTDWAGNPATGGVSYMLKQQVDDTAPSGEITAQIGITPDYVGANVSFATSFRVTDDYSIEKVSYRWLTKLGAAADFTAEPWQELTPAQLGTGLNREIRFSPNYAYDFSDPSAARYGSVKLEVMVEDRAGNQIYTFSSKPAYFNYNLASSNSTVKVNDATVPVVMPEISLKYPQTDDNGDYRNQPRSLIIIPIPTSMVNGEYTEFYVWDPWDWLERQPEYPYMNTSYENPFDRITAALENNSIMGLIDLHNYVSGSFYRARGSVDLQGNSATFTYLAAYYLRDELQEIQDFFDNYYGRMDIYIATTSSLTEFYENNGYPYEGYVQLGPNSASRSDPSQGELLSFVSTESVIDAYTVYLANKAEYSINTITITNAEGKTDAEAERKLHYEGGRVPPVQNLDNVAVTIQIINESDKTAAQGQGYGLEFLDFSQGNAAFKLYYVGDSEDGTMTSENLLKTWDLVKTGNGTQTIIFEPGLCAKNGWYRLVVEIYDFHNQSTTTKEIEQFFMDATSLDITAVEVLKSYSNFNQGVRDDYDWKVADLETVYTNDGAIRLGLAPTPEGWEMEEASIAFRNGIRPEDDPALVTYNLARIRVYNQSYNFSKGLALDTGIWVDVRDDWEDTYNYDIYLADLSAENTDPYGTEDALKLPFLPGRNLVVYEIQATNGMVTTKEIVFDVVEKAAEWDLEYELTYGEGTNNAISAEVWPVGAQSEALPLNTTDAYDQSKYNFRQVASRGDEYAESYTYGDPVENVEYYMLDPNGNISTRKLSITDADGNILVIDSRAPDVYVYAGDHPMYSVSTDSGYGSEHDGTGHTFFFTIESQDYESSIDLRDITLTFDEAYSKVLPGNCGTMGEDGRLTMPLPLALDENGELLKNPDGTYAVWEDFGTNHNGIFHTQVVVEEEENYTTGEPELVTKIHVFGTWKYSVTDEQLAALGDTRTLTVNVYDTHRNLTSVSRTYWYDGGTDPMIGYPGAMDWQDGYVTQDGLTPEGVVGIVSEMPYSSVEGYGVDEMFTYLDKGHLGYRFYFWEAPMITQDSAIIGEDEWGDPIYDPYKLQITDLFGATYDMELFVDQFGELGIEVSFSTAEPTNQPVTVYVNTTGNIEKIASIEAPDGAVVTIDPEDPSKATVTMEENGLITVTTDAEPASQRVIRVSNIDKELGEAYIVYFDQNYNILDPQQGATEVIAVLACDTEFLYATNGPEEYKFPTGTLAGETYTFEYRDAAGNTGTITATLPVDLLPPPYVDDEAPDVSVSLYAGMKDSYDFVDRFSNPGFDETAGESEMTVTLNSRDGGIRARTFRLTLTVDDYSQTKVVVTPAGGAAPVDYASAQQGSTADNVTLWVNRKTATVDVTENTVFDIYIIDELNNMTQMKGIRITSIDNEAPELTPVYVVETDPETGFSMVVAVFHPSEAEKFDLITALTANVNSREETVTDPDGRPVTVIRYYHTFKQNGSYSFTYEDDLGNIGQASAQVNGLSIDAAVVNSISWYGTRQNSIGNVTPEMSDPVNGDITAQLRLSKPISMVELFEYDPDMPDGYGAMLDENSPVQVSFTAGTIDVVYTENVPYQILVRFTASASGRTGTCILPEVGCIDKDAPVITPKSAVLAEDKRSIRFTFESSEPVLHSMDMSLGFATTHSWIAKDDTPVTLHFVDRAGNQVDYTVTDFTGLDLSYLQVSFSASQNGSDPTDEPAIDLALTAGDTLYVYVSKAADASMNGEALGQLRANTWNPVILPDVPGVSMLILKDSNTGDELAYPVYAKATDRIAPVITLPSETVLVYRNATVEEMMNAIHDGVTVTDNLDTELSYTVSGYPDSTQEGGLYSLTYVAQDSAGNKVSAERYLYIMAENTPILWINGEVGLPFGKVNISGTGKIELVMENMDELEDQPVVIKFRKGLYTTGQMKYYATTVEDMQFTVTEPGHYTIYVRGQDRTEFVTYIYVEG